ESIQNLAGVFDGLLDRQRTRKRRPLDELHHQVVGTDVVKLANMRMIQRGDGARFALETFGKLLAGNLDSDDAVEARVAGFVYFPHAARSDRRDDLVGSEVLSWLHGAVFRARRAILLPEMAMSENPSIRLAGSMTCPLLISRP